MTASDYPVTFPFDKHLDFLIPRCHSFLKLGSRGKAFALKHNSLSIINIRMGMSCMLTARGVQFKIAKVIIRGIVVNMMDYFLRLKQSTYFFFHNYTMFGNIALLARKRMAGAIQIPIATTFNPPTFIGRAMLAFNKLSLFISEHIQSVNPCFSSVKRQYDH